jgi:hypothetical protein
MTLSRGQKIIIDQMHLHLQISISKLRSPLALYRPHGLKQFEKPIRIGRCVGPSCEIVDFNLDLDASCKHG